MTYAEPEIDDALKSTGIKEVKLSEVAQITMDFSPKSDAYNESNNSLPYFKAITSS
ncbi:hypothetical protein [Psychrobacter sp. M13]|uniref:hypothetical protein n=1 Tax=Psychrobacter sp. M13 TaxID=3067275 RepID=UPI00273C5E29|nr:hypothetical protein [Psychrobacter sp. M13]WLP93411.1 hypothetical protein Q9G97_07285 [Psychrobacter sp. M13]